MPLGLCGMLTENYWIAGVAWIAEAWEANSCLHSWLVKFGMGIISFQCLATYSINTCCDKTVSHFLFTDNLGASLIKVASSIGFNDIKNAEVKYKREKSRDLLSIPSLYLLSWVYLHL